MWLPYIMNSVFTVLEEGAAKAGSGNLCSVMTAYRENTYILADNNHTVSWINQWTHIFTRIFWLVLNLIKIPFTDVHRPRMRWQYPRNCFDISHDLRRFSWLCQFSSILNIWIEEEIGNDVCPVSISNFSNIAEHNNCTYCWRNILFLLHDVCVVYGNTECLLCWAVSYVSEVS